MRGVLGAGLAPVLTFVVLVGGCAATTTGQRSTRAVEASDFASAQAAQDAPREAGASAEPGPTPGGAWGSDGEQALESVISIEPLADGGIEAQVGEPDTTGDAPPAVGDPIALDAVVGQIGGRPVVASEFLGPLEAQLRALAARAESRTQWRRSATPIIANELGNQIRSELVLSSARAKLTEEQRRGLLYFLEVVRGEAISQARGSREVAESQLLEETGLDLASYARDRVDQVLIREEINRMIRPRAIVSWREIQRAYRQRLDEYVPEAVASYTLIRASRDGIDRVEQITQRLDSGASFAEVAASDLNELPESVRSLTATIAPGVEYGDEELFSNPALDAMARTLEVGEHAGPSEHPAGSPNAAFFWIRLDSIDRGDVVTLYDAQVELEAALGDAKFNRAYQEYFADLVRQGDLPRIQDMTFRLVEIAENLVFSPPAS